MTTMHTACSLLVLLLPMLLAPSPSRAQTVENLVQDGTMEEEDEAVWWPFGSASIFAKSSDDAYNGSYSMHVQGQGSLLGFQQIGVPVTPGKAYKLTLKYRRKSGVFGVQLGIGTSNADFEAKGVRISTSADAWTAYERLFVVPDPLVGTLRLVNPRFRRGLRR